MELRCASVCGDVGGEVTTWHDAPSYVSVRFSPWQEAFPGTRKPGEVQGKRTKKVQ